MLKEQEERKAKSSEFNLAEVQKLWQEYAQNHESAGTKSALLNTKIEIEGSNKVVVFVPTLYIKERVSQEIKITDLMRDVFHIDDLALIIEIDKNKFPEYEDVSNIKTKLSQREIYEIMKDKNPVLSEFVKTLGLRPEGE